MGRRRRRAGLSAADQQALWQRWRHGESLNAIARALDRRATVVRRIVAGTGGFPPPPRCRNPRVLSLAEREERSRGVAAGRSARQLAAQLGRAPSTVCRELARQGSRAAHRAASVDTAAWQRAQRPRPCKLATVPPLRRARTATRSGQRRGQIVDAVSIRARPAEVADRAVPGHREGDLLAGTHHSHIATLVERQSRFTMLVQVGSKETTRVVGALGRQMRTLPAALRRSLTWDRGLELAHHAAFTVATDVQVYFCDPQSPWQRGTNENTKRCCASTYPNAPTWPFTPKPTSTASRSGSVNGRGRS